MSALSNREPSLRKMRLVIQKRLNLSVDELANCVGLSPTTLVNLSPRSRPRTKQIVTELYHEVERAYAAGSAKYGYDYPLFVKRDAAYSGKASRYE